MNDYQFTHADLSGLHYRKGVNAKSAPLPFTPQDGAEFEAWDPETRTLSYSLPPLEDGDERDIIDVVITQEQIAAGPQDAPAPVPQIVSKAQLKLALLQAGIDLSALIAQLPADQQAAAQILVADAKEFRRAAPMVDKLAAVAVITSGQVDDLFRAAKKIDPAAI